MTLCDKWLKRKKDTSKCQLCDSISHALCTLGNVPDKPTQEGFSLTKN